MPLTYDKALTITRLINTRSLIPLPGKSPRKRASEKPEPADPRGTARIVAERAGVSVMTVSRALNGAHGVSEATKKRIREIADELGYEPNISAQALRRGTSDTIAMLLDSSMGVSGEFHSDTLAGLEQVVSAEGYNLLLMVPRSGEGIAGLIRRLIGSTRCQAVVVRFDSLNESEIALLRDLTAPIVIASGAPEYLRTQGVRYSSTFFDNRQGIARAVRHLVAMGHTRIAYLGGTPGWMDAEQRLEGFREEMKKNKLTVREEWTRPCDFSHGFESGSEAMDAVLSSRLPGPSAVVCASDKIAAGAVACARRWDLVVPDDLSVVGFDGDSWGSFSSPPLTTVRQDGMVFGQTLGRLVLEEINNPDAPGRHVMLDTPLIVRQSTAPARDSRKGAHS